MGQTKNDDNRPIILFYFKGKAGATQGPNEILEMGLEYVSGKDFVCVCLVL